MTTFKGSVASIEKELGIGFFGSIPLGTPSDVNTAIGDVKATYLRAIYE